VQKKNRDLIDIVIVAVGKDLVFLNTAEAFQLYKRLQRFFDENQGFEIKNSDEKTRSIEVDTRKKDKIV
jgi:hypothetical protein